MILIGTIVGAGMLGLPMVSSGSGFIWSLILMIIVWILSTLTGLLVIEVNLVMPVNACSYSAMAKYTLGNFGKIITWVSYLFLLYACLTAYMIGASGFVSKTLGQIFHIDIASWISAIIFTIVLGSAVFWSTRTVDYVNRFLISLKGLLLIIALTLITPHIECKQIFNIPSSMSQAYSLGIALPTFVCAFGYHYVLPSLRVYLGDDPKKLRSMVIIGTTISLFVYIWWIASSLGTIPLIGNNSFSTFTKSAEASNPAAFVVFLLDVIKNKWVTSSLLSFSNIALTTSFLGVALGLFDFLAEGFNRKNDKMGRLQTACLTFIPPLLFAILYPDGFLIAINYASINLAILILILPALMAFSLRKYHKDLQYNYRTRCNSAMLLLTIIMGIIAIILALMFILHLLPYS